MRKVVKTLLSLSLMAPAAALALGLGDIKLHSALNQRLNADIELLSVDPAEAKDITVSLASADTFAKLGLDRAAVLMFVKFDVQKHADGKYYIKATTKDVIREPFLDFLIEVKWPSGKVLREYTLLLDPPVSHTEAAPAVSAPATGAAMPMASEAPKAPAASAAQPMAATPETSEPTVVSSYYPQPATTASQMSQQGIVYGPVNSNDTLWRIAQKVRPNKDISVQQMMMALLKANPYAFYDNNINRLKKGYVLRIDDPAMLTAMSKAEAAREVSRQTREWQDYRQAAAAKAAERKPATAEQLPAGAAAAKAEPKLKLVAPEGESKQAGSSAEGEAAAGDTNEQLMLALESSAAQRKENEALQSRVKGLEEQLQDMQRLLALKDADLASLQKQLRDQGQAVTLPSEKAAAAEAAKPVQDETMAAAEKPAADEAKAAEQKPAEAMPAEKAGESAAQQTAEAEQAKPAAETTAPETATAEEKMPQPAPKPAAKPKPKPRVMPQPVQQPSFIESLMQDPIMLGAGGGTIVLLLLLTVMLIRRRRKGGFQESILSGGTSSMLNTKGDEGSGETSFLSDLAISGMGGGAITADEGEVDPLTEAEVFMAYGRNQQAEEVLKKSLDSNPDRPEVIAKLLEVYYAMREQAQFDALAAESADKLKANDELWGKVAAMGAELSPDNALFAGADASAAPAPVQEPEMKGEPVTDDVLDIGLDLDELTAEMEGEGSEDSLDLGLTLSDEEQPAKEASGESDLSDMDFDLDLGETAEESTASAESSELDLDMGALAGEETAGASEELGDLDFDLGELSTEAEAPAAEEEPGSFDLDMGMESAATEEPAPTGGEELSGLDMGDIDFGDLDLEAGTEEPAAEATPATDADFSLDLGELESSAAAGSDDFGDLGDLDEEGLLGDSDEITTKLDLAQAYIEMGDNDGARSMLEEVVEAGNDEQKQQAQDLLGKI